jgi:hypothetical protein
MTDDFRPPIKTRTTKELLEIAGAPKKWNERALKLAKTELPNRNIDTNEINNAILSAIENEDAEKLKKATKSYQISDFILRPTRTVLELLFTWELKKDGYILKAQQQKTFRITLIVLILFVYLLKTLTTTS